MGLTISQEEWDKIENELVLSYVKTAEPIILHQMAMDWNYDNSNVFLNWLIDNPQTDKATALMIYWMSCPRWAKKFNSREEVEQTSSWYLEDFDFIERLEVKLLSGFFRNSNFAYNPTGNHTGTNWTTEYLDEKVVREIPAELFQPLNGREVPEGINFIEGYPPEICSKLDALYDQYEIDEE